PPPSPPTTPNARPFTVAAAKLGSSTPSLLSRIGRNLSGSGPSTTSAPSETFVSPPLGPFGPSNSIAGPTSTQPDPDGPKLRSRSPGFLHITSLHDRGFTLQGESTEDNSRVLRVVAVLGGRIANVRPATAASALADEDASTHGVVASLHESSDPQS